ncbi:junctional sarcoplasmic reticulum protein 1 [Perognathus longimembris pacificus]|uniref:junctional sarcoplasmic reticulum protein 1 n=1 Tax=Perognathus longimembris pacificus TaxID=214514 RepID=UPI002019F8BA|nr:junctional sarcoplasmic reticulum protein 1 [Perognathus longimembris pacificus]
MTTRALEDLDGGLGSCLVSDDLSALLEPCPGRPRENKARASARLADSSSWPHDPQELAAAGGVEARPKKMEKESVAGEGPGPGKETTKTGASPRSGPPRKKSQTAPPLPPPPPPPVLSEELPWGDLSLNKVLVLASLVALLGSAFQLCRDAVVGEAAVPAPVQEPWIPPSSPPPKPVLPRPKPAAGALPSEPSAPQPEPHAPQVEAEDKPRAPQASEDSQVELGETPGEEPTPLGHRGPGKEEKLRKEERPRKEKPRKEEKPRRERPRKEERPRREKPRKEERPRAFREPREALPRRWEPREGGRRPWTRDSRDPTHRKRPPWASPHHRHEEDPQKHRKGKGRG